MGSTMKPTIFNERVATALKSWRQTAKKHTKHGRNSEATTPFSSRPTTPTHGMSPVHLLHNYNHRSVDSYQNSPRNSNFDNDQWDPEALQNSPGYHEISDSDEAKHSDSLGGQNRPAMAEPVSGQLPPGPAAGSRIRYHPQIAIQSNLFA